MNRWFYDGQERWIAMQYHVPTSWPTDVDKWATVLQIKPTTSGAGGPNVGLDMGRNRMSFYGNNNVWGSTAGNIFDGAGPLIAGSYPLPLGRWIKLTWHLRFSASDSLGFVEVFGDLGDGQGMRTLVPLRTRATMKYLNGTTPPAELRVGIYREPTTTTTAHLYVDGITVATTRAAAEANAFVAAAGPPPPPPPPPPPADTTPPETSIDSGPSGTTSSTSGSFAFSSSESGSTYGCRLDADAWASCSSPKAYASLADGSHTFSVRATDAAGNVDASAATRTWTVSTTSSGGGAAVFLSPSGSDTASCSQAAPCRGFNRAYQVAQPGQVVELAAGSYGAQTISHDASKTSASDVTFRPATGAGVTIGNLTTYASHLTVEAMNAADLTARVTDPPGSYQVTDITFTNMDARNFMVYSATDVSFIGGDYGPASSCGGPYGGSNNSIRRYPGAANPAGILIDGVTIHDIQTYDAGPCHMEGLAIFAGDGVTVRNSKFFRNSIYDIFLQANSGPVQNVTLENNWFAKSTGTAYAAGGASAVAFSGSSSSFANTLIRHNSFNDMLSVDDNGVNPDYSNFRVVGNVGKLAFNACAQQVSYSYNVWQGQACNSTDRGLSGGALPFANSSDTASLDYHLTGGVAQDLVPDAASSVMRDIDGDARPMGGARDAGSDERG